MTVAKDIRVPQYAAITRVILREPIAVFATDVVELDMESKRARVVNRAGKVKAVVPFKVEDRGPETATGS